MTQQKGNRTIRQHHEDHATKYREHFAIKACRRDTRFDLASEYTSHSHPIYLPPKNNKHTILLVQEIFFWSVKKNTAVLWSKRPKAYIINHPTTTTLTHTAVYCKYTALPKSIQQVQIHIMQLY